MCILPEAIISQVQRRKSTGMLYLYISLRFFNSLRIFCMRENGAVGVLVQAGFVACLSDASDSIFNSRTVEESTSDTRQPLFTLYTAFIEASF